MANLTLAPMPWFTGFDDDGSIVPHGLLFTYAAGSSTKKNTYTDVLGAVANTNPIVLDDAGRVPSGLYLLPSSYKFVFAPADDTDPPANPIRTQDNIGSIPTSDIDNDVSGTAGEAMLLGEAAYLSDGSGSLIDLVYASTTPEIAFVVADVAAAAVGTFRLSGRVTGLSGLTPGASYYLSGTPGAIVTPAPGNSRLVGQADSITTLIATPNPPTSFVSSVVALTDGATPALDASLGSEFTLIAAGDRTIAVPTNPTSGKKIIIRQLASGGARTLALNTGTGGFRFGTDVTGLTQTTSGKTDYIGCIYNSADNKWDVVAYSKGY